jgi:hypothetical protein
MATKRFIGGAVAVVQVDTLTPGGTIEAGDLFNITLANERAETYTLSVAATGTTVAVVCADLIAAFNACNDPRFTRITAAGVGTVGAYTAVTLTADTAGEPFTCTVATTEAGGGAADAQTFTRAATTASAGPYDYNCTGSWLGGLVPANGDTVYIDNIIKYGLAQSAIEPAYLKITKQCGQYPAAGQLPAYLALGAVIADIDLASGGPVMLDTGAIVSTVTVFNTPAASAAGMPVVWLKANEDGTNITVRKGVVGVGWGDGETTTIHNLDVLYVTQKSSDATVYVGDGVTIGGTTPVVAHKGGNLLLKCAAATVNSDDGALTTEGSGAIATLTIKRSTVISNSTGKVTTANIEGAGILDTTKSNTPREVETVHMHAGATYKRNSVVTTDTITFEESMVITAQAA